MWWIRDRDGTPLARCRPDSNSTAWSREAKAVLFDFFGTLVEYQPDRSQLAAPRTHQLAQSLGFKDDHEAFVSIWDAASHALESASLRTLREFSMTDVAVAFGDASQLALTSAEAEALGQAYVQEWSRHIHPIRGVPEMIRRLAQRLSVAVVSNTHDAKMVPNMLMEMGVSDCVDAVVLSVEHGWLKPHSSIYFAAFDQIGCAAEEVVFVGDNYEADYIGPISIGMAAFLIDPARKHDIPATARLTSALDLARLIDDESD